MPREMRHTAGGRCRRQVWRHETSRGAEDASGGGRRIGRRKMHWKAEEAEAEFEMERRGGRGFPLHLLVPQTYNVQKLENAQVVFSILLRVEKAVFQCISTYAYLPKRPRTH